MIRGLFLALALLSLGAWTHGDGRVAVPTVITNFDGGGTAAVNQITTYDINGNAVDAFQGGIQQFNGTFYWYGMGMGCGFRFNTANTPWCGFNVYSSPDLINWTYVGQLFDPSTWQTKCGTASSVNGCWEPHGAFNAASGQYVFWFLTEGSTGTNNPYLVITCTTPFGGCTQAANPTLALGAGGDVSLFVDPTSGTAYNISGHNGGPAVNELTSTYLTGTANGVSVSLSNAEGYAMYYNAGTYYASSSPSTFGTAPTFYWTSSTPLGSYTAGGATVAGGTSCGGQQTAVYPWPAGGSTLYFQIEQWNSAMNQGLANHFFAPISFSGIVPSVTCSATVTVSGVTTFGRSTAYANGADQTDETSVLFRNICDITNAKFRLQTFVPSRTGTISRVQLPLAQNVIPAVCFYTSGGTTCDGPDGSVTVSVVTLDGSNNPVSTLWSQAIVGSTLSWTPQETSLNVTGASVTAGTHYGIKVSGSNTKACYSVGYARTLQYAPGIERVSSDSGASWVTDAGASLKFSVFLQ